MSQELTILGISAVITAGLQLSGFVVAFALQTEKFYDILGGVNFLALGVYSAIHGEFAGGRWVADPRKIACTAVFVVSRLWLLVFLAWRAHERNGDARFDAVKTQFGRFLVYWIFQGLWVVMISLPVIFVNASAVPNNTAYTVLDFIGIVGFALGTLLEISADVQKSLWVQAGRVGGFCTVGVWRYSRHPKYFGEILQWWCAWLFAYGSGTGLGDVQWWVSILSPLFTMQIVLNTSGTGVRNANGQSLKRYYDTCPEDYAAYRKSTSILLPLPFGIYKHVPMILKRTLFFDLKSYEYSPQRE